MNTLLKTTCQFLLLLVGFDTVTYRKDYDWSPILVGHQQFTPFWNLWKNRKIKTSPESARGGHKLGSRGLPPGRGYMACGHLVCLLDSVFLWSTPYGPEKINIYSPEGFDLRIAQSSSVFVSSLLSAADLEERCLRNLLGRWSSPSSWGSRCWSEKSRSHGSQGPS